MNVTDRARQPEHAPRRPSMGGRVPAAMAALASIAIVVVVLGSRLMASPAVTGNSPSVSPSGLPSVTPSDSLSASPSGGAQLTPTASPTAHLTPGQKTPDPTATRPVQFTTPGTTSNWGGFKWSSTQGLGPFATDQGDLNLFKWRGGYIATGTTTADAPYVLVSTDGLGWLQVAEISAPVIFVAASPTGLVLLAGDSLTTPQAYTVWTSTDGLGWRNVGRANGLANVTSVTGTSAGLVATQATSTGSGANVVHYSVVFSTDGINWTPITIEPNLAWDDLGPQVQSGNGRFFVMGGTAGSTSGALWWSDDGRTWTRATGLTNYALGLTFGRDGILMEEWDRIGFSGWETSTDGGRSWHSDASYGPLGTWQGPWASPGPDGEIGSNGTIIVALKSDGHAWISYDGRTWVPVAWNGPAWVRSGPAGEGNPPLIVLPRGVMMAGQYGAAQ